MRDGSHNDPVRPKGSPRKTPRIPGVRRRGMYVKGSGDERIIWLQVRR
jgi:hypothetical protein